MNKAALSKVYLELELDTLPVRLRFSSIGYEPDTLRIDKPDSLFLSLSPVSTQLPMVEIRARMKMQRISGDGLLPYDFEVWDDYIFSLSRRHTGGQNWIEVLSTDGVPITKHELDAVQPR